MTGGGLSADGRPPVYKAVGVALAIASGVFIGVSFVLKKKGLLAANLKDGKEAGEGYGYLKNVWWWSGMILMIIGEVCNFCAYAFVEAILVTPLGALSVVITAILSSIFLKERLSFVGKIGCFMCIVGSIVIVINAPSQTSVSTIQDMKKFIISPGFLSYAGVVILGCAGIVIWVAPKYGNQSMMVYITVCSLIGGLSVVATQGLGAAVVSQASGIPQFNQWFLYVLLVFVVVTLLVEIIYLNKALNIFNAALVTPTYYVCFTSATIVTSAILFRGFKGSPSAIATVVMGFLQICAGVVLLQLSKSAKDVPDTEIFRGELDQVKLVAEQSEPESEPKADTIRGTAAIIRQISVARRKAEEEEAWRIHEDRARDFLSPHHAGESVEWDGVRRRVTFSDRSGSFAERRRNTLSGQHPPHLGIPSPIIKEDPEVVESGGRRRSMSVDEAMRRQVYPDIENQLVKHAPEHIENVEHDTFLARMRNLFVAKQRSRSSLRDTEIELPVAAAAHRDFRDATPPTGAHGQRPGLNTIPSFDSPSPYDPSTSHIATPSSPHVHFDTSPESMKTYEYDAGSYRTGEYAAVPTDVPDYRPSSSGRHSAKRQFSFQTILHRPKTSPATEHPPSPVHRPHLWSKGIPSPHGIRGSHESRTEEEMMGLVVGDAGIMDPKEASIDDEKRSIRMVNIDDSSDESDKGKGRWTEKASWQ